MTVWLLVVTLMNGRTIASPFETEKMCQKALQEVRKELKGDKNIKSIECAIGELNKEDSKKDSESYISSK